MKVMKFINDLRTVATVGALLLAGLVWAADTTYMRKSEGEKIVSQLEIRRLNGAIKEKNIELLYERDEQNIKLPKALIIGYETEIANIQEVP